MSHPGFDAARNRDRLRLARTFREGHRYEALRPGYPAEAVAWTVGPPPKRVADVGAGTGKFTERLVELGHDVVAVEPSSSMLGLLLTKIPTIDTVLGTGEQTALPDASVDVVTYAQAWHWVNKREASAEAARILRPGGHIGLVWNLIDKRVEWVRDFSEALHAADRYNFAQDRDPELGAEFGPWERFDMDWTATMTTQNLADLVTTRSYYLAQDEEGQTMLAAMVRGVVERHHGVVDDATVVEVPYRTQCVRAALT